MPPAANKKKGLSSNALLGLGLSGCAALVVVALVSTRMLKTEPPPPPPPPPPPVEATVTGLIRYTEGYYRGVLDEDAKRYHVATVTPTALAQPLAYSDELAAPKRLKAEKDQLDTPHLHLATHVLKEWASTPTGQRFRFEHSVLTVTNKSDKSIAYRVETAVDHPEKCGSKGAIAHNAMALAPSEKAERTECLWHPGSMITVNKVEVLELLQPLSFIYVSRLVPTQVLLDERTAAGHEPPDGSKPCLFVPWREIQAAAKSSTASWSDVVDYYARHNCDEYSFWRGYHRWTHPGALPSHGS